MTPRSADEAPSPPGLRERGKQQRVERIVDAGLELLRNDPDKPLTMERIADHAEVSPMTVFNLVGNRDQLWTAMADRALNGFDVAAIRAGSPRERAHKIVEKVVLVLRSDPNVFRELLAGWSHSGRILAHDPTKALTDCLRDAAESGMVRPGVNLQQYGEVMAAGLVGTIHQWTAGLLSDKGFRARAKAVVDMAFDAAEA